MLYLSMALFRKRVSAQRFDQLWFFATDVMRSPSSQWVKTPKHGHCLVSCLQKAVKRRDGQVWHLFIHPLWKYSKMLSCRTLKGFERFLLFLVVFLHWDNLKTVFWLCPLCALESSILWSRGSITCFDLSIHSISSPVCLFRAPLTEFYEIKLSEPPDASCRHQLDYYLSTGINQRHKRQIFDITLTLLFL